MNLKQLLSKILKEWADISKLDFCLLTPEGELFLSTCEKALPSEKSIRDFLEQDALAKAGTSLHYYKIIHRDELAYILLLWGKGVSAHTIGELAVCQVQSAMESSRDKLDKNTFMQNLLLGNYTPVEILNKAKKLRISSGVPRAVFMVETKQARDEHALATIKNIFSARTGSFITSLSEESIVVIKDLRSTETYEDLEQTALMLVDMLNAEAMTQAWVAYGNLALELEQLPNAFKEAKTSLAVGKTFYPAQNTFGYRRLGIGHLIYQLPTDICQMFIDEIFKGESLEAIDDETLSTIKVFFENDLNLSETARQLFLHRNTLVYRFEKLEKRFGLDIRTFEDAMAFKIGMMVTEYINYQKNYQKNS